jgi:hypothetical protein
MKLPILVALLALTCVAQQPAYEYGKPEELKGVKRIFIDTGTDLKNRERIIKALTKAKKDLPDLIILDSAEGAEAVLAFSADRETYLSSVNTSPPPCAGCLSTSTPTYRSVDSGSGIIFIPKNEKARVLMAFSGSARMRWTAWPSEQFAKAFIKAYRKANN